MGFSFVLELIGSKIDSFREDGRGGLLNSKPIDVRNNRDGLRRFRTGVCGGLYPSIEEDVSIAEVSQSPPGVTKGYGLTSV